MKKQLNVSRNSSVSNKYVARLGTLNSQIFVCGWMKTQRETYSTHTRVKQFYADVMTSNQRSHTHNTILMKRLMFCGCRRDNARFLMFEATSQCVCTSEFHLITTRIHNGFSHTSECMSCIWFVPISMVATCTCKWALLWRATVSIDYDTNTHTPICCCCRIEHGASVLRTYGSQHSTT